MRRDFLNRIRRQFRTTSSIMLMLMIGYGIITDALHHYEVSDPISFVIKLISCAVLLSVGTLYNNKFRQREAESKRIWKSYKAAQGDLSQMKM